MKRMMTITARNPTQRAFADCRTTCAARSGLNSSLRMDGGDVKRSTGARSSGGRTAGSRCSGARSSGSRPGVSVIGLLERGGYRSRAGGSDAAGRGARRDDAGLADSDGQWAERDLSGVDMEYATSVHADREAIHPTRGRTVLRAVGLDPEPVVAGPVAGALHPEVLEAGVRLAAEVWATLVERPDIERRSIARGVLTRDEALLGGVLEDDVGSSFGVVGRETLADRKLRVVGLDLREVADLDDAPEAFR